MNILKTETITLSELQIQRRKELDAAQKNFQDEWDALSLQIELSKDKMVKEIVKDYSKANGKKWNFNLLATKQEISVALLSHPGAQIHVYQVNVKKKKQDPIKAGMFRVRNEGKEIFVERLE